MQINPLLCTIDQYNPTLRCNYCVFFTAASSCMISPVAQETPGSCLDPSVIQNPDMPSPALSQRPCCQLCASVTTVSVCVCMCVRVCFSQPQNKTQFDLLQWPVKLGCEAAPLFIPLMVSLSPLLLLNLPQTPVMCTLVNIHIYSTLEEGEEGNTEKMKERQTNCRVLEENWWIL